MIVKFFNRGNKTTDKKFSTGGRSAKNYLLNERVEQGTARLLKGDPEQTTEIINALKFSTIYTSGCLSFEHDESKKITDELKTELIDGFERALFGDFDMTRTSGYWVEHTDKDRLELNFVFANVDLASGNALPVYYHQNDVHRVNDYKDLMNLKHGLADPNDPNRQRLTVTKELNQCKTQKEIKDTINNMLVDQFANEKINSRDDVINFLTKDLGLKIGRKSDKYLSVIKDDSKPIRLKGLFYEREFESREFIIEPKEQARPVKHRDDTGAKATITELESRLRTSIQKRTDALNKRFQKYAERTNQQLAPKPPKPINADPKQSQSADTRPDQPTPPTNGATNRGDHRPTEPNNGFFEQSGVAPGSVGGADQQPTEPNSGNSADEPKADIHNVFNLRDFINNSNRIITVHDILGTPKNDNEQPIRRPVQPTDERLFRQFADHCRQSFKGFENHAKQGYQRLSDTASGVTKSFRKYAAEYSAVNRQLDRSVATTSENNRKLDGAVSTASENNRQLNKSDRAVKQTIQSVDLFMQKTLQAERERQQQIQRQPKLLNESSKPQEAPKQQETPKPTEPPTLKPLPGPKRRP